MKKFKRALLRPFYGLYWAKHKVFRGYEVRKLEDGDGFIIEKVYLRNFNSWLDKHGYWRLTDRLDNLKLLVPKSFYDVMKKFPNANYITPLEHNMMYKGENKLFYHYEEPKPPVAD